MLNFDELKINDIKMHLVSVDNRQITYTNAETYRDYLDKNLIVGKNKLKYNVLNLTLFFTSVNTGYKSKLYKAILTQGNKDTGYEMVFDQQVNSFDQIKELFKKHKVKVKLDAQ